MRRTYNDSPIVEAVCEFRFDPEAEWDLTIPGLVYERLRGRFPIRRPSSDVPAEIEEMLAADALKQMKRRSTLMRFVSENEGSLVQIGQHLLAISHFRPYPTWEQFRLMIAEGLSAYREVANPETLVRLGLRYINRIDIPEQEVTIAHYLNAYPVVPITADRKAVSSWLQRVQIPYAEDHAILTAHIGSIRHGEHDGVSFMLDLDFATQNALPTIDNAFTWLDQAHEHIEEMFESSITDRTRELFKEKAKQ